MPWRYVLSQIFGLVRFSNRGGGRTPRECGGWPDGERPQAKETPVGLRSAVSAPYRGSLARAA